MTFSGQEIEVKFYVRDLEAIAARLEILDARLLRPRLHEVNLRYDRPDGSLAREHRLLRLRRSDDLRLTYKGPGSIVEGAMSRQEIEFSVGDFEAARQFLEALDYQIIVMYEKYRTTYEMKTSEVSEDFGSLETLIMLDELPFGNFVEIEGESPAAIRAAAGRLSLDWGTHLTESYLALFEQLRGKLGFTFCDLTFDNFAGLEAPFAQFFTQFY